MSDLFKDHKPELSEDEDRRLWQRVRAIPGEAEGASFRPARAPWWRALWTMPSVRYGAPAFAVLVAAVIWVVERSPAPTLEVASRPEEVPEASLPPQTQDAPMAQSNPAPARGRATSAPPVASTEAAPEPKEEAALRTESKSRLAGLKDDAAREDEDAAGSAAEEGTRPTRKLADAHAPQAGALAQEQHVRGGRSAETFAQPPTAAAPKDLSSDGIAHRLAGGSLPDAAALGGHPLVREAVGAAFVAGEVPFPLGVSEGRRMTVAIEIPASGRIEAQVTARGEPEKASPLRVGVGARSYSSFEDAPPSLQAAVLAFALERALARPASVPRERIGEMLGRARKVARRSDAAARPGAERLVQMLEGAHGAWPTP